MNLGKFSVGGASFAFLSICVLALNGCASSEHISTRSKNQFVTEFFAYVESVEYGEFESYAGEAAAVGAAHGALYNLDDAESAIGGAIVGAFIGGFITSLFEGDRQAYIYSLEAVDGDLVSVVLDDQPALPGDCVKVSVAGDVRLWKVPDEACESHAW